MKLYLHPASPNCVSVLVTASLLGLSLETETVDLLGGAQNAPGFRALNPNGLVPTLVDGAFVLWETQAITQYLADGVPDSPLWPQDRRLRADIARWQFWAMAHWMPALRPYLYENLFKRLKGQGEPDPAALDKADADFRRLAAVLDTALGERSHAVGDRLTLADIALASYLMYAQAARIPLQDYPAIRRWLTAIEALPSWQAATAPVAGLRGGPVQQAPAGRTA